MVDRGDKKEILRRTKLFLSCDCRIMRQKGTSRELIADFRAGRQEKKHWVLGFWSSREFSQDDLQK